MRGITEERLKEVFSKLYWTTNDEKELFTALLSECTELNAWQPIDENTPKDRDLVLYFSPNKKWVGSLGRDWPFAPTHWQELPKDPK